MHPSIFFYSKDDKARLKLILHFFEMFFSTSAIELIAWWKVVSCMGFFLGTLS